MDMSVYEFDSLMLSLCNLAILKLFHERGVNVKEGFTTHIEHIESGGVNSFEICREGFSRYFENFSEYCLYNEKLPKQYEDLFDYHHDYVFILNDSAFRIDEKVTKEELTKRVDKLSDWEFQVEIVQSPDEAGLAIAFDYLSMDLFDFVKNLLELPTELNRMRGENV